MKLRTLGVVTAFFIALLPRPAQAQGDFIKNNLKHWIEKTGVYVSATTRTSLDDEVDMGPSIGVGIGFASEHQRSGRKYPFSFSGYSGNLETFDGNDFGRIKARNMPYWADPFHREPNRINSWDDGRGVYFEDPNGHNLEILTRPYGSGGTKADHPNPLVKQPIE